jgi:pimeloyl-ACP methyl ester carboxylesterase
MISNFIIRPAFLQLNDQPLIDLAILDLLDSKQAKLTINVYDSDDCGSEQATIVFIHGNSFSKDAFEQQIEYYSKQFRVIAFDLLGHGQSTKISDLDNLTLAEKELISAAFYNPYAMVAEINQLLIAKNINNAHILGWSLGGHLAYSLANINSNLVTSIIAINAPPVKFIYTSNNFKEGFYDFFPKLVIPGWINNPQKLSIADLQANADYCGYNGIETKDKFPRDALIASDPLMRKYLFLDSSDHMQKNMQQLLDGERFVKSTPIPLLLVTSRDDTGVQSDYIAGFSNSLIHPTSKVYIMQDAKHAPFITHPEEFQEMVIKFLGEIENMRTEPDDA